MPDNVPIIDLSKAPGSRESWDRPFWIVLLWAVVEPVLVTSSLQLSSRVRVTVLRWFGAEIGPGVIMRPGLKVRFPWKLSIGANSWIGERVWLHNQDRLEIGHDTVISQDSFVTTGTHAVKTDMALVTRPTLIGDGVWVTSRCMVLGGSRIGTSALILPNTVVKGDVPANAVFGAAPATVVGDRFSDDAGARRPSPDSR